MKYLIRKEVAHFLTSTIGCVVASVWLLAASSMLWFFPGRYNIAESGYASLSPFFTLAPILFFFMVPAVTMRLFSEECRTGTLELLLFRPLRTRSIVISKYVAAFLMMIIVLLPTLVYVGSVWLMSTSGLDTGEVIGGYLGMCLVLLLFTAIGLCCSALTSNQLVAFLVALVVSFFMFYGFDMLASLFSNGSLHNFISDLGVDAHYRSIIRGVVNSQDILYFAGMVFLFLFLAVCLLERNPRKSPFLKGGMILTCWLVLVVVLPGSFVRIDLTQGQRYSLSSQSRSLINSLDKPLEVILYLNGDLNPAFDRLRKASVDMLEELSQFAGEAIVLKQVNPSVGFDERARQNNYLRMDERGMKGISVNEYDKEGKLSSKVVFPWMELVYDGDTLPVSLLRKNTGLTAQEILNQSAGDLEYGLTEGIRLLTQKNDLRIAFIEGHGELPEPYVYEATGLLSRYYNVDRGRISGNPEELYPYQVLIIASPQAPFGEAEKFAIDQYLMQGGALLFYLDGVGISEDEFNRTGESVTLKKELNLDDLLFAYGLRINPVTVQDMNCTPIRIASSQTGASEAFTVLPWYFSPLLQPSPLHPVSRNISPLKSELVSTLSLVGNDGGLKKTVLLATSANAHTLPVPEKVSLRYVEMPADPVYFKETSLPVAAIVEGEFQSAFRNRLLPEGAVEPGGGRVSKGKNGKVLVAASGSLIKNEWRGQGDQAMPLPLGFEPINGEQFGNGDFLVNAVNYLAGNGEWLSLRMRSNRLYLLDKQAVTADLLKWQLINLLAPVLLFLFIAGFFTFFRRKRYN